MVRTTSAHMRLMMTVKTNTASAHLIQGILRFIKWMIDEDDSICSESNSWTAAIVAMILPTNDQFFVWVFLSHLSVSFASLLN